MTEKSYPYIILQGGLVQASPDVPLVDLDEIENDLDHGSTEALLIHLNTLATQSPFDINAAAPNLVMHVNEMMRVPGVEGQKYNVLADLLDAIIERGDDADLEQAHRILAGNGFDPATATREDLS